MGKEVKRFRRCHESLAGQSSNCLSDSSVHIMYRGQGDMFKQFIKP